MSYILQIIETEKQPVLSVKTTTSAEKLPNIVGKVYGSILNRIIESGEEPLGPAFIAYYNMDMKNLTVEIGFPVAKEIEGKEEERCRVVVRSTVLSTAVTL
jgi:effector-binding domain-containing protein